MPDSRGAEAGWRSRLRDQAGRPRTWLLLDQTLSSGGNAAVLFAAAAVLSTAELNTYALLQFLGIVWMGLGRGLLSVPGLALRRGPRGLPFRRMWSLALLPTAALGILPFLAAIGGFTPGQMLSLAFLLALPAIQDLGRHWSLAQGRLRLMCVADFVWLVISVVPVLFLGPAASAASVAVLWGVGAGVSALILLIPPPHTGAAPPPSIGRLATLGKFEVASVAVNAAVNWALMRAALAIDPNAAVAAYRMGLSMIGPLTALNTARTTATLRASGAQREHWRTGGLLSGLTRQTVQISSVAALYCAAAVAFTWLFMQDQFGQAGVVVVSVTILGALARTVNAPRIARLRAAGFQRSFFVMRAALDVTSLACAVIAGWWAQSGSLVLIVFVGLSQGLGLLAWNWLSSRIARRSGNDPAQTHTSS